MGCHIASCSKSHKLSPFPMQVGAATSIDFSPLYPYNYAVTSSTRVIIFDAHTPPPAHHAVPLQGQGLLWHLPQRWQAVGCRRRDWLCAGEHKSCLTHKLAQTFTMHPAWPTQMLLLMRLSRFLWTLRVCKNGCLRAHGNQPA